MWVVHTLKRLSGGQDRITPTYVGSTIADALKNMFDKDHPHVCG